MAEKTLAGEIGMHGRSLAAESAFGLHRLRGPDGLTLTALPTGQLYSIEHDGVLINQVLAGPLSGGIGRIYLRRHDGQTIEHTTIVGPGSSAGFVATADRFIWRGTWGGIRYLCQCRLLPGGWVFDIDIDNGNDHRVRCDAVLLQDVALATRAQARNNELFTSQYLDHSATRHPRVGHLVMTRQNLAQPGGNPWLMQGCFPSARGFTTDGFDFFGAAHRGTGVAEALSRAVIGQRVRQYETAYIAIQASEIDLLGAASHRWTFFARFLADHPEASSPRDADRVAEIEQRIAALQRGPMAPVPAAGSPSVLAPAGLLQSLPLDEAEITRLFPGPRRHEESVGGRTWSFFAGGDARHVVLRDKELAVARPHGHIMRAGRGHCPDAPVMSGTFYAAGAFGSQITLGNTSLAKLTSGTRDPLNILRHTGVRLLVRSGDAAPWLQLGVPSAFEMAVDSCRWHYRHDGGSITVECAAAGDAPEFAYTVSCQPAMQILLTAEIAAGPAEYESSPRVDVDADRGVIAVRPDPASVVGKHQPGTVFRMSAGPDTALAAVGGAELLGDASGRLPYVAFQTHATTTFACTISGAEDVQPGQPTQRSAARHETGMLGAGAALSGGSGNAVAQIQDALTWFARDAMIHLSTPRGLEQAHGGAWGVRDVCQGPVEFLLSYGHDEIVADILRKLFAHQYRRRNDWPQWFMFPPYGDIQSRHCHGDVLIWPLKALCDYLEATDDESILHERTPYTDDDSLRATPDTETILAHADRLLDKMRGEFVPGLSLPRFGEGDWDDSLQPAQAALRERMVSSWTTQLMFQTLRRYAAALTRFGQSGRAQIAGDMAADIAADFQRHLVPSGVVAGFALFDGNPPRPVEYLLHPTDARTGLKYRLIPMTRGIISGIFSPQQAAHHLELIRKHLVFPDGARLMDRPTVYDGGREHVFRRSESAAFFGREIGLQYVHAHLRYAEALAAMGQADELLHALLVVNPIAVTDVVKNARPRQRNCFFSSSDAAFSDRYEASREYDGLRGGEIPVDGGWRIYSSGPGLYTNMVFRQMLGLRRHFDWLIFDPVLPASLAGMSAELPHAGRMVRYEFVAQSDTPQALMVNGAAVPGITALENPYRKSGIRVRRRDLEALLRPGLNHVQIQS